MAGAVGVVTGIKGGWCSVRWSRTGHEDRYRHGEGGQYEVVMHGLEVGEGLSAGVEALVDVLDTNLAVLRARLNDRNFSRCLRVCNLVVCADFFLVGERSLCPALLFQRVATDQAPAQVVWLSALDALQTELHDTSLDVADHVRHPRAAHVLRHLTESVYADGAGLPLSLIQKSSAALVEILGADSLPPLEPK